MCKHLWQAGHNVLALEYFGHGEVTGTRVGALGHSMGAAVTIMGSALANEVEVLGGDYVYFSCKRSHAISPFCHSED
jgi:cephalosporin-C deacetylase-like acetyl esterase